MCFSPPSLLPRNFLVATSWDNEVRLWEIHANGSTQGVGMIRHEAPVLASAWRSDGSRVFSAGCDNVCKQWDPASNATDTVAYHDAPIRQVAFVGDDSGVAGSPFLLTASWDRTLKYWDLRAPPNAAQSGGGAMGTVSLPERCYAMDVSGTLVVVGTADRELLWFDLRQPLQPAGRKTSPLRYQTRCISIFADRACYAVSSVEGRCAIEYLQDTSKSFAFKCHRVDAGAGGQERITSVNCVTTFPLAQPDTVDVLATAGGDGRVNIWNKAAKVKTKGLKEVGMPVLALQFNATGSILGYAVGYDWSQGAQAGGGGSSVKVGHKGCKLVEVSASRRGSRVEGDPVIPSARKREKALTAVRTSPLAACKSGPSVYKTEALGGAPRGRKRMLRQWANSAYKGNAGGEAEHSEESGKRGSDWPMRQGKQLMSTGGGQWGVSLSSALRNPVDISQYALILVSQPSTLLSPHMASPYIPSYFPSPHITSTRLPSSLRTDDPLLATRSPARCRGFR
eukprot:ctg_874.g422